MLWKLSIFYSGIGGVDVKHGAPYGRKIINGNMFAQIVLILCLTFIQATLAETEYFPGLRKPPQIPNWGGSAAQNENAYLLAQLSNIIEEQARRRFQMQLQQQQQQQLQQQKHQHGLPSLTAQEVAAPGFTYQFPVASELHGSPEHGEQIPFAVSPADPRYYEKTDVDENRLQSNYEEDYQELTGGNDRENSDGLVDGRDRVPAYKLKAPMEVKPKILANASKSRDVMTREDLKSLVEKLQKEGQEGAIVNNGQYLQRNDVTKKQVEMDPTMGMYVVALIAGVSAAVTVGLIALGIGWYTLHKKGIAAADVEYPAYGVTGPNKDISPSGDRRLAQSAQMYHYQHQKQQIIAMENRTNNERNGNLTDVESDDENEEGDYTVYECPGLAPTGEMEVKNPLFLDDPTPATPATVPTQQTKSSLNTKSTNASPPPNNKATTKKNQSSEKK